MPVRLYRNDSQLSFAVNNNDGEGGGSIRRGVALLLRHFYCLISGVVMTELVTIRVVDHIADVRLNRPEKMNALSLAMLEAINAAAEQIMADRTVRAVVISGEGRAFCAGLDLANFTDPNSFGGGDPFGGGRGGDWPNFYQKPGYLWKDVPVPVICALHGVVYGGGLQIALGADIRIAHGD